MRKVIMEGERIPKLYGIAYRDLCSDTAICYPFPFHVLVNFSIRAYWAIVKISSPHPNLILKLAHKAKLAGYRKGYRKCESDIYEVVSKKYYRDGWESHARFIDNEFSKYLEERKLK